MSALYYIRNLSEWILEGFNGCIISYGERLSGKTATMFGFDNQEKEKEYSGSGCNPASCGLLGGGGIASGIIKELYNNTKHHLSTQSDLYEGSKYGKITIALSAWLLRGNQIIE